MKSKQFSYGHFTTTNTIFCHRFVLDETFLLIKDNILKKNVYIKNLAMKLLNKSDTFMGQHILFILSPRSSYFDLCEYVIRNMRCSNIVLVGVIIFFLLKTNIAAYIELMQPKENFIISMRTNWPLLCMFL